MKNDEKYFNVPIQLFRGFMIDSLNCLNNIFDYAIYEHSLKLDGMPAERFKASCRWYGVTAGNESESIRNGRERVLNADKNSPRVGISKTMWFDFYKNDKSDFDKICLLGYLSIKSILQNKAYCKIDNKFWLSRMDGNAKSINDFVELSEAIKPYANEYQTVKIKKELRNNWGLTTYSRHTRGFYVSFDLSIEQLVFEAEKRRKTTIDKQYKLKEDEAIKKAIQKLYANTS